MQRVICGVIVEFGDRDPLETAVEIVGLFDRLASGRTDDAPNDEETKEVFFIPAPTAVPAE